MEEIPCVIKAEYRGAIASTSCLMTTRRRRSTSDAG